MLTEKGTSLIETVVALALLGIIGVAFLSALATTSNARLIADEHVTARIIAESQMENIKQQEYASSYNGSSISAIYPGYTIGILVNNLRNGNIQKIAVTVSHHGRDVETLESYKVRR